MQNTNDESLGKYERKIYSNPEWVIDRVGELVMSIEQALNCGEEKRGIFYPYETTADLELSDRTEDFKSSMIKLDKINQKAINKGVMHSKLYKNEKT